MKILLIEDDANTAELVRQGLTELGHTVDVSANGLHGMVMGETGSYDVLVVDRMLPGRDGLQVVRDLRSIGVATPVLFLTALGGVVDRVAGLESGGDDYLVKPFAFSELQARIQALARRPPLSPTPTTLTAADLEMDTVRHQVTRAGRRIDLTAHEFKLLAFLMERPGQMVTRTMLLEGVWELHFNPRTNVVDAHISRLRTKIDRGFERELIRTIRGAGYCLDACG